MAFQDRFIVNDRDLNHDNKATLQRNLKLIDEKVTTKSFPNRETIINQCTQKYEVLIWRHKISQNQHQRAQSALIWQANLYLILHANLLLHLGCLFFAVACKVQSTRCQSISLPHTRHVSVSGTLHTELHFTLITPSGFGRCGATEI